MTEEKTLLWKGIPLRITFNGNYSESFEHIYGHALTHIQVYCTQPLPITKTGYRSLFIEAPIVREEGGYLQLIQNLLDQGAKQRDWRKKQSKSNQLSLF